MKTKTINYRWYTDPGHAWLRVSTAVCKDLGILDRVSQFSYQSRQGTYLYLEEDCDAGLFLQAVKDKQLPCHMLPTRYEDRSRVRHLPNYMAGIRQLKQDKLLDAAIEAGILHIKVIR